LEETRSNDACTSVVQVGDYVMIWIDSLEPAQDGYETLCVEESSLRKLKELCPWVEEIDSCRTRKSGYKSSQTLWDSAISKQ
jgi:hypothetical protein